MQKEEMARMQSMMARGGENPWEVQNREGGGGQPASDPTAGAKEFSF